MTVDDLQHTQDDQQRGLANLCHSNESMLEFVMYCGNLCGDKSDIHNYKHKPDHINDEEMTGPTVPAGLTKDDNFVRPQHEPQYSKPRPRNHLPPRSSTNPYIPSPYASRAHIGFDRTKLYEDQLLNGVRPESNYDDLISCDSTISSAGKSLNNNGRVCVTFDSVLLNNPYRSERLDNIRNEYKSNNERIYHPAGKVHRKKENYFAEEEKPPNGVEETKTMDNFEGLVDTKRGGIHDVKPTKQHIIEYCDEEKVSEGDKARKRFDKTSTPEYFDGEQKVDGIHEGRSSRRSSPRYKDKKDGFERSRAMNEPLQVVDEDLFIDTEQKVEDKREARSLRSSKRSSKRYQEKKDGFETSRAMEDQLKVVDEVLFMENDRKIEDKRETRSSRSSRRSSPRYKEKKDDFETSRKMEQKSRAKGKDIYYEGEEKVCDSQFRRIPRRPSLERNSKVRNKDFYQDSEEKVRDSLELKSPRRSSPRYERNDDDIEASRSKEKSFKIRNKEFCYEGEEKVGDRHETRSRKSKLYVDQEENGDDIGLDNRSSRRSSPRYKEKKDGFDTSRSLEKGLIIHQVEDIRSEGEEKIRDTLESRSSRKSSPRYKERKDDFETSFVMERSKNVKRNDIYLEDEEKIRESLESRSLGKSPPRFKVHEIHESRSARKSSTRYNEGKDAGEPSESMEGSLHLGTKDHVLGGKVHERLETRSSTKSPKKDSYYEKGEERKLRESPESRSTRKSLRYKEKKEASERRLRAMEETRSTKGIGLHIVEGKEKIVDDDLESRSTRKSLSRYKERKEALRAMEETLSAKGYYVDGKEKIVDDDLESRSTRKSLSRYKEQKDAYERVRAMEEHLKVNGLDKKIAKVDTKDTVCEDLQRKNNSEKSKKKKALRVKEKKDEYDVRATEAFDLIENEATFDKTVDTEDSGVKNDSFEINSKRESLGSRQQKPVFFQVKGSRKGVEVKSTKAVFHMKAQKDSVDKVKKDRHQKSPQRSLLKRQSTQDSPTSDNYNDESNRIPQPWQGNRKDWSVQDDRTIRSEGYIRQSTRHPKDLIDDSYDDVHGEDKEDPFSSSTEIIDRHRFDGRVLGTSINDESAKPHVMSIDIMERLQDHLPYCKRGENFWLKYSLVRDGASMHTMLHKARGSQYTILAVETLEGEVFGAFTSQPWHVTWGYFGTPESFLWRLRRRRGEKAKSREEKVRMESEVSVYKYAGHNPYVQFCNNDRIAVGAGSMDDTGSVGSGVSMNRKLTDWGFGLAFNTDLQQGTSAPCATFQNPPLSKIHADGSRFDVLNLEVWTLTPCLNVVEATKMEQGKLMIDRNCMTI